MSDRLLSPSQEPIFAQLATDPRSAETTSGASFGEIAADFLAPTRRESIHTGLLPPWIECPACGPFRIMFRTSPEGRRPEPVTDKTPHEGVIVQPRQRKPRSTQRGKGH